MVIIFVQYVRVCLCVKKNKNLEKRAVVRFSDWKLTCDHLYTLKWSTYFISCLIIDAEVLCI